MGTREKDGTGKSEHDHKEILDVTGRRFVCLLYSDKCPDLDEGFIVSVVYEHRKG
jgi:hypothetical protein